MNNTNRGLNRTLIMVVGLVLLAAGALVLALSFVPAFGERWSDTAPQVSSSVSGVLVDTPLGDTGSSWLWIGVIVVLLVVAALLVAFIARQGRGHTRRLLTQPSTDNGSTVVESAVAEQLMTQSLADRPELVSSHVSTYRVRGASVLKISVTCRRGVSPTDVTTIINQRLRALDGLVGTEVPALIQISGGFRARTTKSTRLS